MKKDKAIGGVEMDCEFKDFAAAPELTLEPFPAAEAGENVRLPKKEDGGFVCEADRFVKF